VETKTELASEIDTRQAEEKVIEMGDASEETKGWYTGPFIENLFYPYT
jgi:hypothetical protein